MAWLKAYLIRGAASYRNARAFLSLQGDARARPGRFIATVVGLWLVFWVVIQVLT